MGKMERRKQLAQQRGGATSDVVQACQAYSQRLMDKPVRVKLHVSSGKVADGNIGLEKVDGGDSQIVVQAHGSNLFGLVKREFRHVFKVGELERSSSTHTSFLLRSIKQLSKGDEKMKKEILERSLSLVHKNEAVDMTFASKAECDQLGDWIAAKWSVAMLQKSFKGNPRITMALQGRNLSMAREGAYDAPKGTGGRGRGRGGGGGGDDEVDGAGFGRLPKLDAKARTKLEEDLLDGVHVTYHDLSLKGYISRSTPRRLRYDCQSKAGLVYLEASFEGDGDTIVEPMSSLVQVGGGLSAHGPTSSLLRATAGHNQEQRAAAVSLVFKARSMDITCGCAKDAHELVLYFSEVRGFTRAKPPDRSMLAYIPEDTGRSPDRQAKESARDSCISVRGGGGHRGEPPRQQHVHAAGAAMLNMSSANGAAGLGIDVEDAIGKSAPSYGARQTSNESPAGSLGSSVPSFSTRFRSGYGDGGGDGQGSPTLQRQSSAASGFNATASLRDLSSDGVGAQHKVWKAGGGGGGGSFTGGSLAVGAPQFHSTPAAARRATIAVSPTPETRAKARRGEHPHALQQGRNRGRKQRGDSRTAETPVSSAGPAAATAAVTPPPTYEALVNSGSGGNAVAGAGAGAAVFAPSPSDEGSSSQRQQQQQQRPGRTVGTLARRNASRTPPRRGGEGQQQQQADPTAAAAADHHRHREERSLTPTSRGRGVRSPARGGTARPLPPTPDDIASGATGAAGAADHRARHRANLVAQFPGSDGGGGGAEGSGSGRTPPPPPPPPRPGSAAAAGSSGSSSRTPPPPPPRRPGAAAGAGGSGSSSRSPPPPPRRPGAAGAGAAARPFTNPADVAASVRDSEHDADVIKTTGGGGGGGDRGRGSSVSSSQGGGGETVVERRRFGGIERRTVETRAGGSGTRSPTRSASPVDNRGVGGGGHGGSNIEDDDSFTTFRVKGPTIDDIDRSGSGAYYRRRSPTASSSLDHSGAGARRSPTGSDVSARSGGTGHSASPTRPKLRLRKTGIGKAFREGAKIFSSGSHKNSGSPVSRSPSPAGGGGSRGLGSLDASSNGGGGRIRSRFLSNPISRSGGAKPSSASAGIGGVEDFSTTSAKYGKFRSSPAAAPSPTRAATRRETHS